MDEMFPFFFLFFFPVHSEIHNTFVLQEGIPFAMTWLELKQPAAIMERDDKYGTNEKKK